MVTQHLVHYLLGRRWHLMPNWLRDLCGLVNCFTIFFVIIAVFLIFVVREDGLVILHDFIEMLVESVLICFEFEATAHLNFFFLLFFCGVFFGFVVGRPVAFAALPLAPVVRVDKTRPKHQPCGSQRQIEVDYAHDGYADDDQPAALRALLHVGHEIREQNHQECAEGYACLVKEFQPVVEAHTPRLVFAEVDVKCEVYVHGRQELQIGPRRARQQQTDQKECCSPKHEEHVEAQLPAIIHAYLISQRPQALHEDSLFVLDLILARPLHDQVDDADR